MKEIHFYKQIEVSDTLVSFEDTRISIENHEEEIHTTSIAHLSMDLTNEYKVFLHGIKEVTQIFPGMNLPNGKELRFEHNILKMYLEKIFDYLD